MNPGPRLSIASSCALPRLVVRRVSTVQFIMQKYLYLCVTQRYLTLRDTFVSTLFAVRNNYAVSDHRLLSLYDV